MKVENGNKMERKMGLQKIVDILNHYLLFGKITDLLEKENSVLLFHLEFSKTFYINSTQENKAD